MKPHATIRSISRHSVDSSLRQRWRAGGCEQAEDTAGLDRFGAAARAIAVASGLG
jgi:hypothetical protein